MDSGIVAALCSFPLFWILGSGVVQVFILRFLRFWVGFGALFIVSFYRLCSVPGLVRVIGPLINMWHRTVLFSGSLLFRAAPPRSARGLVWVIEPLTCGTGRSFFVIFIFRPLPTLPSPPRSLGSGGGDWVIELRTHTVAQDCVIFVCSLSTIPF